MKITIQDGWVTIQAPIDDTRKSKSGKSFLLVSTNGTLATEATYKGKQVSANINITIPTNEPSAAAEGGKKAKAGKAAAATTPASDAA